MLEDDGNQNCDAGHILANHLGGYGNIPTNIFPQNLNINRGSYADFENDIFVISLFFEVIVAPS